MAQMQQRVPKVCNRLPAAPRIRRNLPKGSDLEKVQGLGLRV